MRTVYGIIACVVMAAIAAGCAYLGVWVMLVGGIVEVINQFKSPTTDAAAVALAVAKIIFFGVPLSAAWIAAIFSLKIAFATAINANANKTRSK